MPAASLREKLGLCGGHLLTLESFLASKLLLCGFRGEESLEKGPVAEQERDWLEKQGKSNPPAGQRFRELSLPSSTTTTPGQAESRAWSSPQLRSFQLSVARNERLPCSEAVHFSSMCSLCLFRAHPHRHAGRVSQWLHGGPWAGRQPGLCAVYLHALKQRHKAGCVLPACFCLGRNTAGTLV